MQVNTSRPRGKEMESKAGRAASILTARQADSGEHLGTVQIPEPVGNLHWGGPDWSSMFVCASTGLYRFQTKTTARRDRPLAAAVRM